jgi:uncharacterized protein (DUF305 family)
MKQSILFGIVGLVVGGLLTYTVTVNTVSKTETPTMPSSGTAMQHGGQGSNSMSDMMASLEGKKGEEFDKSFLSSMIVHHQDAVEMSKAAQTDAERQEIKDLADDIIKAQESEIEMMQQWQKDWGFTQ